MKAGVLYAPEDLRIEELPIPSPKENEIVVKIRRASICGATDYNIYKGYYQKLSPSLPYPHIMGHEACGEVVEVGRKVKDIKVGDRIAWGGLMEGAFAEYICFNPENAVIANLSEHLDFDEGTLLEPLYGVLRGVYSLRMRVGDKAVVLGCGPIGLLFIQCLRLAMAEEIIAVDLVDGRLSKAKELGADMLLNPKLQKEWGKEIKGKWGEVDVVVDTTGSSSDELIDEGIEVLKPGGKYMIYGHPMAKMSFTPMKLSSKGVKVVGVLASWEENKKMMELGEKLVARGLINLKTLITNYIKLEEVEKWIRICGERKEDVLKVVIEIS